MEIGTQKLQQINHINLIVFYRTVREAALLDQPVQQPPQVAEKHQQNKHFRYPENNSLLYLQQYQHFNFASIFNMNVPTLLSTV